jgi:hypothetical protein
MGDGNGLAEALLGLEGFRVLAVVETVELMVLVETTADFTGCGACGVRAVAHERMDVEVRDLACFGRPVRLVWRKRRWRCIDPDCDAGTWTEVSSAVSSRHVLTQRAGAEACRQVGMNARSVADLARELGVSWWTVMDAVDEHGTPLVEDRDRVGPVRQLGVDETSFLAATPKHATIYATGLVDLEATIIIDMVEGNAAADLRRWTRGADPQWLAGIEVVATDLAESFGPACRPTSTTPAGWPTRSMWCGWRTAAWTRCAAGCRTRPSGIEAANPTRSTGSASCSSPATNASTTAAEGACCSAYASVTPTTKLSAPGWPRSPSVTSTSPSVGPTPAPCWTRPSSAATPMTCPRSSASARPSSPGAKRSSPTTPPAPATDRPKA